MDLFVYLLKPWKHSTKKIYIHCSNQHLCQPLYQLKTVKRIINCDIQVESNFSDIVSADNDIYIIPTIEVGVKPQIFIQNELFLNNKIQYGTFLILQSNWINTSESSIIFSDGIYSLTSKICNDFFKFFFENINNTVINIYFNINDEFTQNIIQHIKQFQIFYRGKLVKFNCYPYLSANLQFQENDFLINRLQDFDFHTKKEQKNYLIKKINAQEINANNVNINYVEIIDIISDFQFYHTNIRYFSYIFELFINMPIDLE